MNNDITLVKQLINTPIIMMGLTFGCSVLANAASSTANIAPSLPLVTTPVTNTVTNTVTTTITTPSLVASNSLPTAQNQTIALEQLVTQKSNATLLDAPKQTASLTAQELLKQLQKTDTGRLYLDGIAAPKCGVKAFSYQYTTVGGKDEQTTSSGTVMLPVASATDNDPVCSAPSPVVLYAHGTSPSQSYDLANLTDTTGPASEESQFIGAYFAAQGYTVIAPNYAGYNTSKLDYHPYLNRKQQANEMVDALKTGLQSITQLNSSKAVNTQLANKLFLTGYSQGGYVAMAALDELQNRQIPVTAAATLSGPYGLEAFGDKIIAGHIAIGASVFIPMMITSYQMTYGNLYQNLSDVYAAPYDKNPLNILPTKDVVDVYKSNKLPLLSIFKDAPTGYAALNELSPPSLIYFFGFSPKDYLLNTKYRYDYYQDMIKNPDASVSSMATNLSTTRKSDNTFRQALQKNDIRDITPKMPTLLCASHNDPTVFYTVGTGLMSKILLQKSQAGAPLQYMVLDLDNTKGKDGLKDSFYSYGIPDPIAKVVKDSATVNQAKFTNTIDSIRKKGFESQDTRKKSITKTVTLLAANYHEPFVMTYCMATAKTFFDQY